MSTFIAGVTFLDDMLGYLNPGEVYCWFYTFETNLVISQHKCCTLLDIHWEHPWLHYSHWHTENLLETRFPTNQSPDLIMLRICKCFPSDLTGKLGRVKKKVEFNINKQTVTMVGNWWISNIEASALTQRDDFPDVTKLQLNTCTYLSSGSFPSMTASCILWRHCFPF